MNVNIRNRNLDERMYDCDDKAFRKMMIQFYYDRMNKDVDILLKGVPGYMINEVRVWAKARNTNRYRYGFITVNSMENTDVMDFVNKIKSIMNKIWIDEAMWCIEWGVKNKNLHAHIKVWIKKNKNPYRCRGEVYNTMKNMVGSMAAINIRYSNTNGCFEDYIDGLKGRHTDVGGKRDKKCMPITEKFRELYKLENIYRYKKEEIIEECDEE